MTIKPATQKDYVKTALRLPPDLHAELHLAAGLAERTYNGEIVHRLRQSFRGRRAQQPTPKEGQQP